MIGVAGAGRKIDIPLFQHVFGRVRRRAAFGDVSGRSKLPGMEDEWLRGDFDVVPHITQVLQNEQINTAFDPSKACEAIRSVMHFEPEETVAVRAIMKKVFLRNFECRFSCLLLEARPGLRLALPQRYAFFDRTLH